MKKLILSALLLTSIKVTAQIGNCDPDSTLKGVSADHSIISYDWL